LKLGKKKQKLASGTKTFLNPFCFLFAKMAAFNQIVNNFQQQAMLFNRRISAFFSFIGMKLKHFKALSIQEQISFGLIGIGLVLVVTSAVLFLV